MTEHPENTRLRPLFLVNDLAKAAGEEVTYAYDDLAFISHSDVLVQFTDDSDDTLHFFIHRQLDTTAFEQKKAKYEIIAKEQGTTLVYKGRFSMDSKEGREEFELQFFPGS